MTDGLLDIAERTLRHAAGPALVRVRHARGILVPFGPADTGTARQSDDARVDVVCLHDGRAGTATVAAVGDAALRDAMRLADAAARSAAAPPHTGIPDPAQPEEHHGFDPATAALDTVLACDVARAALDVSRAAGAELLGVVELADTAVAVASTAGARLADRVTRAAVSIAGGGRLCGDAAVRAADLDAAGIAAELLGSMPRGEAAEAAAGPQHVVFGSRAVAQLLDALGGCAFNGLLHAQGHGALAGRLGDQVGASSVTLTDAPRDTSTLPRAFDAEGVPKTALTLVQDGVARSVVHDARSAAVAGGSTTGHALAPGGAPAGPRPSNLVLRAGGADGEAGLMAPVARGLLIPAFADLDLTDPGTARFTARTRGALLVEDGVAHRPVGEIRIADDALRILMATEELGSRARLVIRPDGSGIVCPPLRASGVPIAV